MYSRVPKWMRNGYPLYFMDQIYKPVDLQMVIGKLCFYHALKEGYIKTNPKDTDPTEFYTPTMDTIPQQSDLLEHIVSAKKDLCIQKQFIDEC